MKMKSKGVNQVLLLSMITIFSCTNQSLETVTTVTPFNREGHYDLKIRRSKKDPSNPVLSESLVTETILDVDVQSANQDSTYVKWKYGESIILGDHATKISEEEQKAINIYQGIEFDLIVKGNNQIHVKNYSAIRSDLERLFLNLYGNDSLTAESEMYARVKSMFESKAGTPGLMLENFFPEISLLFSTIGKGFNVDGNLTVDSIANPYGAGFMSIISEVKIENIEDDIVVSKFDSIPQEILDEKMLQYLNEVYGAAAANIPEDQMPKSTYLINLEVELSKDFQLLSVSSEKQFSQGKDAMVSVLEVMID